MHLVILNVGHPSIFFVIMNMANASRFFYDKNI